MTLLPAIAGLGPLELLIILGVALFLSVGGLVLLVVLVVAVVRRPAKQAPVRDDHTPVDPDS